MLSVEAEGPIIQFERKFFVLIPSRFPPIALFERIANGNNDAVATIESLTNPRLAEKRRLVEARNLVDERSPSLQNWNHAPFAYLNPEGSRFFGPQVPCLELSGDVQTALAVSVGKRQTFLSRTKETRINLDMRVLSRTVRGKFVDGRTWPINQSPQELRKVGQHVLDRKVDGLLFRSAERPKGDRIAVLNPKALNTAIQEDHYRFVWDGQRIVAIYSFNGGEQINPCRLSEDEEILAA